MKTKALCYARKSHSTQNIDSQVSEIQRWCDNNNFEPIWFKDTGTGTNLDRPEFQRLQKEIFMGEAKTVVVTEISRVSRSLVDGLNTVADWLKKDIRLVATTQSFDFSGAMGQTIASLLFGFASIENEQRAERQARGILEAKKRGVYKGRKKGTTTVDVDRIVEYRRNGMKLEDIAKKLGVGRSTVIKHINKKTSLDLIEALSNAYEVLQWGIDNCSVIVDDRGFPEAIAHELPDRTIRYPDNIFKALLKGANEFFRKEPDEVRYMEALSDFTLELLLEFELRDTTTEDIIKELEDTVAELISNMEKAKKVPTRRLIDKVLVKRASLSKPGLHKA